MYIFLFILIISLLSNSTLLILSSFLIFSELNPAGYTQMLLLLEVLFSWFLPLAWYLYSVSCHIDYLAKYWATTLSKQEIHNLSVIMLIVIYLTSGNLFCVCVGGKGGACVCACAPTGGRVIKMSKCHLENDAFR